MLHLNSSTPLGVPGLALARSASALLNLIILIILLRKQIKETIDERFLPLVMKVTAAALVMGIVIQFLKYPLAELFDQRYFFGILAQGLVAGVVGLTAYGVVCNFLHVDEMIHLRQSLHARWVKLWNVGEGIDQAEKL